VQKIPTEPRCRIRIDRFVKEQATKLLATTEDFATARSSPPWIGSCEVEQFERACERAIEPRDMACLVRANGAIDFTPDVRELLQEGKGRPALP